MITVLGDDISKELEEIALKLGDLSPIEGAIQDEFFSQNPIVKPGHKMNIFEVSANVVRVGSQSESFAQLLVFDESQLFDNVINSYLMGE